MAPHVSIAALAGFLLRLSKSSAQLTNEDNIKKERKRLVLVLRPIQNKKTGDGVTHGVYLLKEELSLNLLHIYYIIIFTLFQIIIDYDF